MSENPQPGTGPDTSANSAPGQDVELAGARRLSGIVVGHLTDQARRTAEGARARRVTSAPGQPGMTDLTPLRELVAELMQEARKVRPRERTARALRQAADRIDPPGGN